MARPSKSRSRQIRHIVYKLKQLYGIPGDLYKMDILPANLDTGRKNVTVTKYHIPKLLVLSTIIKQKFEYDLAFIAANKNFTYGAQFRIGDKQFLIPKQYLPSDYSMSLNDYIVIDGDRYNLVSINDFDYAYNLHVRRTQDEQTFAINDPTILVDLLPITDSFDAVISNYTIDSLIITDSFNGEIA